MRPLLVLFLAFAALGLGAPQDAASADDGTELVGRPAPALDGLAWLDEPLGLEALRGRVVLLRWWTDTCPFCARSAPALRELHERYGASGLVVVGVLHPKPRGRPVTDADARAAAERLGFDFPIALDRDWSVLNRYWLAAAPRAATSASFLLDRDGVIRHVHPGPVLEEGALETAIDELLEDS